MVFSCCSNCGDAIAGLRYRRARKRHNASRPQLFHVHLEILAQLARDAEHELGARIGTRASEFLRMQRFRTKLVGDGPGGAWVHLYPPVDVVDGFGSKGQIRVSGTINGVPFRSTLMPQEGAHRMAVTKELRAAAGVGAGSEVDVTMERDTAERTVDVPAELAAALAADAAARERFDRLAFSHRKEYADWIASAKKPETRLERARKAVTMIAEGAPRR